jgi:carboxylesterase type B
MSVSMHQVSPKSRGLFKRVILMSGSMVGMALMLPPEKTHNDVVALATALGWSP